jgi:Flp pilus assembly protein protease CpaA
MLLLLNTATILSLLVIAFQDFKERKISAILIAVTFIFLLIISIKSLGPYSGLQFTAINTSFILFQFLFLFLFYFIRHGKPLNFVNTYLGTGDILFILAICPLASPVNFIAFYVFGLIIALTAFIILKMIKRSTSSEIPLAGILSVTLICLLLFKYFAKNINLYNDEFLFQFLWPKAMLMI